MSSVAHVRFTPPRKYGGVFPFNDFNGYRRPMCRFDCGYRLDLSMVLMEDLRCCSRENVLPLSARG